MMKKDRINVEITQSMKYKTNDMSDEIDKPVEGPIYSIIDPLYEPSKLPPVKSELIVKMYEEIKKIRDFIDPELFIIIAKRLGIRYLTPGDYKRLINEFPILREAFVYDSENNVYFVKITE